MTHQRNLAIDSLRTAMMCVVMFGHAMLPYVTVPRRFNDPNTHLAFDAVGVFLYGFAMQAFFVTAGFSAAALFHRRGARAFWRDRLVRIFLPLLVAYLLLTPLTRAAYVFAQAASTSGDLAAAWQTALASDWLRWGKVYHLWFLASLILFSGATIALRALLPTGRRMPGTLWLLAGVTAFTVPSYVSGTGQGTDRWMQLSLYLFFVFGWWLYSERDTIEVRTRHYVAAMTGALLVLPVCIWATLDRLFAEDRSDVVMGLVAGVTNALVAVGMTLGLLGLFQRRAADPGPLARYAAGASYWIYLVHYPIVVAAGGILSVTGWAPPLKYLASVALALPIILGTYELWRRPRQTVAQ